MFCIPSVSCVPLETSGTQDTEVRQTKHNENLETLEISGTQDTEARQTKHNRKSIDTRLVMENYHFVCLTSVSCFPDVSSVSRLSNVCLPSVSCVPDEGIQNIGQSRDTGNIRNTRHRSKTNQAQQTI
jgi:hypothetical protein